MQASCNQYPDSTQLGISHLHSPCNRNGMSKSRSPGSNTPENLHTAIEAQDMLLSSTSPSTQKAKGTFERRCATVVVHIESAGNVLMIVHCCITK
jgi:hypothetical protein